jgi:hypothetical protein
MAATVLTATGGKQMTRAAGLGVAVKSSSDDLDLVLALATASSPASEVVVDVTLMLSSIKENDGYPTFDT